MEKFNVQENVEVLDKEVMKSSLLELDLEVYEVDSTTMIETMGASAGWNSCSSIVKTVS